MFKISTEIVNKLKDLQLFLNRQRRNPIRPWQHPHRSAPLPLCLCTHHTLLPQLQCCAGGSHKHKHSEPALCAKFGVTRVTFTWVETTFTTLIEKSPPVRLFRHCGAGCSSAPSNLSRPLQHTAHTCPTHDIKVGKLSDCALQCFATFLPHSHCTYVYNHDREAAWWFTAGRPTHCAVRQPQTLSDLCAAKSALYSTLLTLAWNRKWARAGTLVVLVVLNHTNKGSFILSDRGAEGGLIGYVRVFVYVCVCVCVCVLFHFVVKSRSAALVEKHWKGNSVHFCVCVCVHLVVKPGGCMTLFATLCVFYCQCRGQKLEKETALYWTKKTYQRENFKITLTQCAYLLCFSKLCLCLIFFYFCVFKKCYLNY